MHLWRCPRRNRKLLLVGLAVDPSGREDRLPRATGSAFKFHRLKAGALGLLNQSRIDTGRGRDPHRRRAPAGAAGRGASRHWSLLAKCFSSKPTQPPLAPRAGTTLSAITSSQNGFCRSSALSFLEEVAILSSRACLFEQTNRDLVALMGEHQNAKAIVARHSCDRETLRTPPQQRPWVGSSLKNTHSDPAPRAIQV